MSHQAPVEDDDHQSRKSVRQQSNADSTETSTAAESNDDAPPFRSIGSVLSQYLIHRLSKEQHLSNASASYSLCDKDVNDSSVIQANELQATVSTMVMYYSYLSSGPGLVSALIIGAYADAMGRRFTLLLPLSGMTAKILIIVIIMKFDLDLRLLYLAFGVDGLTGTGFVVIIAMCTIIADTNATKVDRIFWLTLINVMGSIFVSVSNIVSGICIEEFGYFPTSLFLTAASALCFLIPFFFLAETKPNQLVQTLNLCTNVRRVFGFFLFDGTLRHKLTFIVSISMFFFAVINEFGGMTIDTLYQLHKPFCWNSKLIGYYSALKSGGAYFLAMFLLAALKSRVKMEYVGLLAAVSQGASYCLQAFVKTTWQFFLVPIVAVPGCLITSVIRGLMSSLARPESQ
ncbi:unnamed protein product, partial [Candidula unifasciata]